jgi:hypothetical protein
MLIAITLLAVTFYILIVRPTIIAERFVGSVNNGELGEFHALTLFGETIKDRIASEETLLNYDAIRVHAECTPRSISDLLAFRRRITVFVFFQQKGYSGDAWRGHFQLIAGALGVSVNENLD